MNNTRRKIIGTFFYLCLTMNAFSQAGLFSQAVLFFDFASDKAQQNRGILQPVGKVSLAQPLAGDDYALSLAQGGDGMVGKADSGWFIADAFAPLPDMQGYEMTLCLRVKDLSGGWKGALLSRCDANNAYRILEGVDNHLVYEWHTSHIKKRTDSLWLHNRLPALTNGWVSPGLPDFLSGKMRLKAPARITGTGWHTVIVRFDHAKLELFIDGVLINEEFPHGNLQDFDCPFALGGGYNATRQMTADFRGLIDHFAIWNYALTDSDIETLNGGAAAVALKRQQYIGPEAVSLQYYHPPGYEQSAGDCMPFFHDGVFRLFYLLTRHHHHGKWETGGTQFAQISTSDLINITPQPLAVPFTHQWESGIGTGDAIFHNDTFYLFFTDCGTRVEYTDKPHRKASVFVAVSTDGIHFTKKEKPVLEGHDSEVFWDEKSRKFYMLTFGDDVYESENLYDWTLFRENLLPEKKGTSEECPNYFEWNGWHYYILGRNAMWKSRKLFGPFEEIEPTVYGGLMVPKVAEFTGNRRLAAGFLNDYWYGGFLVLRELTQDKQGNIHTRFVPELIPATDKAIELIPQAGKTVNSHNVNLSAGENTETCYLAGLPTNCRIRMNIVPQKTVENFGLLLRGENGYVNGCELRFEPASGRFCIGLPRLGKLAPLSSDPPEWGYNYHYNNIKGLDKEFSLDIIVKESLVDICIDNRLCMTTFRRGELTGDKLCLFTTRGQVTFANLLVEPIE